MKKPTILTIFALSLLIAAGCSRNDESVKTTASAAEAASTAPAEAKSTSSLPDLGEAPTWTLAQIDGTSLASSAFAGKVVVVDFWATWCPPCREEIPGYIEMQRELEAAGVVIVGISLDQAGPGVVKTFAEKFGINYPLVMGDSKVVEAFGGIEAIPTTFLIDREGKVRHRKVGSMSRADYEPLVRSLL